MSADTDLPANETLFTGPGAKLSRDGATVTITIPCGDAYQATVLVEHIEEHWRAGKTIRLFMEIEDKAAPIPGRSEAG